MHWPTLLRVLSVSAIVTVPTVAVVAAIAAKQDRDSGSLPAATAIQATLTTPDPYQDTATAKRDVTTTTPQIKQETAAADRGDLTGRAERAAITIKGEPALLSRDDDGIISTPQITQSTSIAKSTETKTKTVGQPLPDRNPKRSHGQKTRNNKGTDESQDRVEQEIKLELTKADLPVRKLVPGIRNGAAMHVSLAVLRLLDPLLDDDISATDLNNVTAAFQAANKKDFDTARLRMSRTKDRAARKLIHWLIMTKARSQMDPHETWVFFKENPDWPGHRSLVKRAEAVFAQRNPTAKQINAFYKDAAPETGVGKGTIAMAYLEAGETDKAHKIAKSAWHSSEMSASQEEAFITAFGNVLDATDHQKRLDMLLRSSKRSRIAHAKRTMARLDKKEKKKFDARVALLRRSRKAESLYKALPKVARQDPGVLYARTYYLSKKYRDEKVWDILKDLHKSTAATKGRGLNSSIWWPLRHRHARRALNAGHPGVAYDIARHHGNLHGDDFIEANFVTGWIALRFRTDPDTATKYFKQSREAAQSKRHIAKLEYWLGRAADEAGNIDRARKHYQAAAEHRATYYGQLALHALHVEVPPISLGELQMPSPEDISSVLEHDAVRAAVIAHRAGLNSITSRFLYHLSWRFPRPGQLVLLSELAAQISTLRISLKVGKVGVYRGMPLEHYAYPVNALPEFQPLNEGVESGFIHALVRQESEFNTSARSWVGARGLMQIMPGTARQIARQHKVKYSPVRLTNDPSYNVMLGAAHLRDLMDKYKDAYILTLVAYNAGPGRVREWIKAYGDPRAPNVDVIDWVERIPFNETRSYVKRIMASVQIYRALMGEDRPLRLIQDLSQGGPKPKHSATLALD